MKARENLAQIASSFDKVMALRMKQMSEITNVGAARFQRILQLTNLQLQHAVFEGCGDPQVYNDCFCTSIIVEDVIS